MVIGILLFDFELFIGVRCTNNGSIPTGANASMHRLRCLSPLDMPSSPRIHEKRYLLYLLACETGLRRGELRSLTVASVDLKGLRIFVKGGIDGATKNKDEATQYITPETGELLREYIKGKMPNVPLFPTIHHRSARMVKADCEAAGIEAENHKGKLTFHSLRHTCGSYLLAHGVHPKEVQEIMLHKDYGLTMNRYGHSLDGYKREAVNKLPRFARNEVKEKSA